MSFPPDPDVLVNICRIRSIYITNLNGARVKCKVKKTHLAIALVKSFKNHSGKFAASKWVLKTFS